MTARLPTPGGDSGSWGSLLNEFLAVVHAADGVLKPGSVTSTAIGDGSVTAAKFASDVIALLAAKYELPPTGVPVSQIDVAALAASPLMQAAAVQALQSAATVTPTGTWNLSAAPRVAGVPLGAPPRALGILYAGLAARGVFPCRIVFAGSSTVVGLWATSENGRFVNRFVKALQQNYPSGLGAETNPIVSTSADFGTLSAAAGVHGYNAGEVSTFASNYLTAAERTKIGAVNPRMVVHVIGSNDYASGVAPAAFKASVQDSINDLKAKTNGPCVHLLVHAHRRMDVTSPAYPWAEYGRALEQIAAADTAAVAFMDLSDTFALAGIPGVDPLNLLDSDNIHLTDAGHALLADLLCRVVGIAPLTVAVTPAPATVVSDDFNRADASTLGNASSGPLWVDENAWAISSNAARGNGHAFIEMGISNQDVSATVTYGGTTGVLGVQANAMDSFNRIVLYLDAGYVNFAKVDAGSLSALYVSGTPITVGVGVSHTLRIVTSANTATAYVDGAPVYQHTFTASDKTKYTTYTKAGMRANGQAVGTIDNFLAVSS